MPDRWQFRSSRGANPIPPTSCRRRRRYVLRRKPPGRLLPSAHAIEREFRVIEALGASSDVPVPAALLLCEDETVVGTAFYLMDWVAGRILRNPSFPEVPAGDRPAHSEAIIDALARLHRVDVIRAGLDVAAMAAKRVPGPDHIDPVQPCQRIDDRFAVGRTIARRHLRKTRIAEYPPRDPVHQIERRADDGLVLAKQQGGGHRHVARRAERLDHPEFAFDGMRGGQQAARRLAPQYVASCRRRQEVGGIRLAPLELRNCQRSGIARQAFQQVRIQTIKVEFEIRSHGTGARRSLRRAHLVDSSP